MTKKNIWSSSQSLMVVFDYKDDDQLKEFRKALDKMLNNSQIGRLIIIVNIPKDLDKTTLPPHFLIYYTSPNDYSFFGKLKDVQLEAELRKTYDLLIWFDEPQEKLLNEARNAHFNRKVIVNSEHSYFDLSLTSSHENPDEMLNFVTSTLEKINLYD